MVRLRQRPQVIERRVKPEIELPEGAKPQPEDYEYYMHYFGCEYYMHCSGNEYYMHYNRCEYCMHYLGCEWARGGAPGPRACALLVGSAAGARDAAAAGQAVAACSCPLHTAAGNSAPSPLPPLCAAQ